jgi:hypothetical protein
MPEIDAHVSRSPPGLVYHYTDQHGFLGIISIGTMWATSIDALNDSQEFIHGKNLAIKLIEDRLHSETESTRRKQLECLLTAARHAGINICAASWSEVKDRLSQWRAYSRNSTGY